MGFFNKIFAREECMAVTAEKDVLYLPVGGEVILLGQIGDGVFSEGILGKGCGIVPAEETVYAPGDGEVIQVADTKHAVGLRLNNGAEVLIHIGMDTVEMNGEGFNVLVKTGQRVQCGQPLVKFNMDKIKAANHPVTTAFVITNSDDFEDITVLADGQAEKMTAVIKVRK